MGARVGAIRLIKRWFGVGVGCAVACGDWRGGIPGSGTCVSACCPGMADASQCDGTGLARRLANVLLRKNDIGQSDAVAATSCAGHGETGRGIAGAVSVCSKVRAEAAHGAARGGEPSADTACGGGPSRNCSTAERQLGRWCSGPRPRRGISIRDAGAWHRSTSAMNRVGQPPKRSMRTNSLCGNIAAVSAVAAKSRWGGLAAVARLVSSRATGCAMKRSEFCCQCRCAVLAGAVCWSAVPVRAFAVPCCGLAGARGNAGCCEARRRLAWCRSAWYSAAQRITQRRRLARMTRMLAVPKNLAVGLWPGAAIWARKAPARCPPCWMRVKTRVIRTATALEVVEARAPARVGSGWAARADVVAVAAFMGWGYGMGREVLSI